MLWGCMFSHGIGRLHIVSGTVKAMDYIEILQNKLLPTTRYLLGNQSWIFQDDITPLAIVQSDKKYCMKNTAINHNAVDKVLACIAPPHGGSYKALIKLEADAARRLNVSRSVVQRLWDQYQSEDFVSRRPVPGRPRATTPAEDRFLALSA
ncbi:HTH_Tnp_Tc3_2 domain-containing protein [Trichonephila clavipes]|nr:HTH_Tnp_Tc3_2 domain-containing protein [Trichonephila clavipes]